MAITVTCKNNWVNTDVLTPTEQNKYGDDIRSLDTAVDGKAATSHTHSAANITSGTLAVARGGTGQTNLANVTVGNATNATTAAACSGNASTATALQNARTFRTNLASTSAVSFNGTANVTPGVTGTLPYGNGGTGSATAPVQGGVAYGTGSAIKTTAAGTSGYILKSNGTSAPAFVDPLGMTSICTYFCNTDDSASIDFDDMATLYPNTVMFFDSRSGSAVYTNAPTKWLNSSASKGYLFNYTPTGDKSSTYMQIAYWCGTGGTSVSSYPSVAMRFASSGTWTSWRYLKLYDSDPN